MQAAIIIALVMLVMFAGMGTAVFIVMRKVDPKNQDTSENPNIVKAQEFLPFEDIRNHMILLGGHRYRAVLSCSSTNYQLKTDGEREQIEMSFQRFINTISFPVTFFLQTKVIDNTARLADLRADMEHTVQDFPNMANYAEQYQQDMENLTQIIGNNQQKRRYIIVTYDEAGSLGTLSEEEKIIHAEKELLHRCNQMIGNLQSVGVKAEMMKTADIIELVYSCYHRDDYSYAQCVASGDPFSLFVQGREDKFEDLPKAKLLDLILGEAINRIELSNVDRDPGGRKAWEALVELRERYAGFFKEV